MGQQLRRLGWVTWAELGNSFQGRGRSFEEVGSRAHGLRNRCITFSLCCKLRAGSAAASNSVGVKVIAIGAVGFWLH